MASENGQATRSIAAAGGDGADELRRAVAMLTHELNNILATILGRARMVEDDAAIGFRLLDHTRKIQRAAGRGAELVDRMACLATTGSTRTERVSLGEAIARTCPDVPMKSDFAAGADTIPADPATLDQLLNAVHSLAASDAADHRLPPHGLSLEKTSAATAALLSGAPASDPNRIHLGVDRNNCPFATFGSGWAPRQTLSLRFSIVMEAGRDGLAGVLALDSFDQVPTRINLLVLREAVRKAGAVLIVRHGAAGRIDAEIVFFGCAEGCDAAPACACIGAGTRRSASAD